MPHFTCPENPFDFFNQWFEEAATKEINDPNAMSLATVGQDGHPSVRIVLLKMLDERGFVFYTNLESRKGLELKSNQNVSLCFHWKSLLRQIRIEGKATPVSDEEADAYFAGRPQGSQLAAWASQQSRPLESREVLEQALAEYALQFGDGPVPRPPFWSGYRVAPRAIEFWQDRPFRLHDRVIYEKHDTQWIMTRLYP